MNDSGASDPIPAELDGAALERLRELDPQGRNGLLPRVMTTYLNSLTRILGQLEAEAARPDAETVARLAHQLKSSSASVGAQALARAAAEVERALRAGDTADPGEAIARLLREGRAAAASVDAMLVSLSRP
ncbi:MAG: Hpt domain-containing protein [Burkholderiales bacterium]|nr:Hpt domain-containing protein [Burkholderiales bacterium]MDE1927571.1 Hpt domain-containing protein [Burkholderiales bacterium]MDE2159645.1 Hpt domain-containing protein [Burkholderiales bacterium]MDE2505186.1 Hpt domain-containing protein [Burkholderiales bacterium]